MLFLVQPAFLPSYTTKHGVCASNSHLEVTSKTGAPLKQYRSPFPVNTMALQGVPLTAGSLIIPRQSMDVQAAAQIAASQFLVAAGSPEENRRNKNYKTELCRPFEESGYCKYGEKCQFAHGQNELQNVPRHPKFKTELCKNYHQTGYCPYGKRCHFIHSEDMCQYRQQQQNNCGGMVTPTAAIVASPCAPVAQALPPPQLLSIQASPPMVSLGSAGESPVPSTTGSDSPSSYSPGLGSYSSSDEDPFFGPAPMTFPVPNRIPDACSRHFVFPSSPDGKFGSTSEDVDVLAAGLEDMFVPAHRNPLGPAGNTRLTVFRRLTSSS